MVQIFYSILRKACSYLILYFCHLSFGVNSLHNVYTITAQRALQHIKEYD